VLESGAASSRQTIEADIACVGFGPAMGGFLTVLSRALSEEPSLQSNVLPGMPFQVICFERADDLGFGVSGVVTRARGIREVWPGLEPASIPMAHPVWHEKLVYLHDPIGASRRSAGTKLLDLLTRPLRKRCAVELPWTPPFLHKHGGLILSIGQFNQWVAAQIMAMGTIQIWPSSPVAEALQEGERIVGIRLADQGTEQDGTSYLPGMEVRAALTVVGDGPVGAVGRQLTRRFPREDDEKAEHWAVGMKFVVDLPEDTTLEPGTVLHTFGYPEPEIFGFLYVHPENIASLGIFVPSFFDSPVRTAYRYLQHWMRHPYLWRHLQGATLRSWGAKSLNESGLAAQPAVVGDGFARIGEGSGSTNALTGSGVDEAWTTGSQLAEAVVSLLREGKPLSRENLEKTYLAKRHGSWVEREGRVARRARDGFTSGFLRGLIGMGLAGFTAGRLAWPAKKHTSPKSLEEYYRGRLTAAQIEEARQQAAAAGLPLHDLLMRLAGWPEIEYDGKLLVSHQDALLLGGKVQGAPGYADHVAFLYPNLCEQCGVQLCVEICSGQALTPGENGVPAFDREKCVHCGACVWSCPQRLPDGTRGNIQLRAAAGGLHSAEN